MAFLYTKDVVYVVSSLILTRGRLRRVFSTFSFESFVVSEIFLIFATSLVSP